MEARASKCVFLAPHGERGRLQAPTEVEGQTLQFGKVGLQVVNDFATLVKIGLKGVSEVTYV